MTKQTVPGTNHSDMSPERRREVREYVKTRWSELAEFQGNSEQAAITYIFLVNSGGAIAILGFMGATRTTTPFVNAPAMLFAFALGVVLVGFLRAIVYYRVAYRFHRWRDGVRKFYGNEWSWEWLIAHDEDLGWSFWPADVCGLGSFACFLFGVILGVNALP
ncbi:MAG: hypothetical protein AB7R40_24200 [Nitrospiraceae bacterium]